ncbi:hypothetical protein B0H19DRAFT_1263543 [Mycena capillaripes]|nr:hypothetical protein B0H19DRAFT_1263543 [Mycena capillaripes]
MRFSIVALLAAFATSVAASPKPLLVRSCSVKNCVLALAPLVISCAAAAAEDGVNPFADADCLFDAAKDITHFPAACNGCF